MSSTAPAPLDGNAAAGPLSAVLAGDPTVALARCDSCGNQDVLARAVCYRSAMGTVLRCAVCGHVLLVVVERKDTTVLSAHGCTWVRV